MKIPIILILCLFMVVTSKTQDQQKLLVDAGKSLTINQPYTNVNELVMEDNSSIIITDVTSWKLNARTARIGKNCKIVATGKNGKSGNNGKTGGNASRDCQHGGNGGHGTEGVKGNDGIDLEIFMEIVELGVLTIDTRGGRGGDGGHGGKAGNAGKADVSRNCRGGNGGTGGNGGNAGGGGAGGDIVFEYSIRGKTPLFNRQQTYNSVITLTDGGNNGRVGNAGEGGAGGHSVSRRACSFCPKVSKGGGAGGSRGRSGDNPAAATNGKLTTNAIDRGDCLEDVKEETYAVVIAISETESKVGDNPVFVEDAERLATVLRLEYNFDGVDTYYNIERKKLENILTTLGQTYGEDARVLIYLSGHGLNYNGFPSFNTSDDYPMPFKTIYSYVEDAVVNRMLLVVDACHSGKIFDNRFNSIEAYTPHQSRLIYPRETCDKKALTIISSGFDDETVPARDFVNELINKLRANQKHALTAETLFYQIKRTDFKSQKPVFGKSKDCADNQCIESDFVFFKN